jgi:hypothetical protein
MRLVLGAAIIIGLAIVLFIVQAIWLSVILAWGDEQTKGTAYYGASRADRDRFKRRLRMHARLLYPMLRFVRRTSSFTFPKSSFQHKGVSGPIGMCSADSFAHGAAYEPRPEDVFVVTQMKCGTTWMQQVAYETLMRGNGDIADSDRTMYALSPWIESSRSVSIEDAPLIGDERPSRIIKTHFPASLCPYSRNARYIYVARHPASCFASCIDFIATNIGTTPPPLPDMEAWFTAPDRMWWGTWTDHVRGWWERSRAEANVLFVHFEEMRKDLPAVVRKVADFLGMEPLTDDELERVVEKAGFEYMQQHRHAFEMNPPHLLQTDAELFVRGTADRHKDVPADVRQRIMAWSAAGLEGCDYPLADTYPDVAAASGANAGGGG